jgi:hypothetical protein
MARTGSKRLEALTTIGTLLAPKAKSLAKSVAIAFTDPVAYLAAHEERMNDRGIDEPEEGLAWIALIDALQDAKALVEIDWKTDAENVEWAIKKLHKQFQLPKVDDPDLDERSTWELLEIAGALLRKKKLQLAHLDMHSDAYCLVNVPLSKFAMLASLAKKARYGTADAFGSDLIEATKERVARMKKHEREEAKESARKPPPYRFFQKGKNHRAIQTHTRALDAEFEAPGMRRYENHYFSSPKETKAAAKKLIASWRADGFREISPEVALARPRQGTGAYLGWIGPFASDAHYFLENKKIVRCIALRGDAVMSTGGIVGKDFGELTSLRHSKNAEKAFADDLARLRATKFYQPIERDGLMALYAKKRRSR